MYDNQGSEVVLEFLPEMITALRQTNKKTRKAAKSLLRKIAEREGSEKLIQCVLAGLGGVSSLVKADSVAAMTLLMKDCE